MTKLELEKMTPRESFIKDLRLSISNAVTIEDVSSSSDVLDLIFRWKESDTRWTNIQFDFKKKDARARQLSNLTKFVWTFVELMKLRRRVKTVTRIADLNLWARNFNSLEEDAEDVTSEDCCKEESASCCKDSYTACCEEEKTFFQRIRCAFWL